MTRAEFAAALRARVEYHDKIGDGRVAGALQVVLEDLENVDGLPERAQSPDRLLELDEAAEHLAVTTRWLKENRPAYVVELSPRMLRVSERKLEQFLRTR